MGPSQSSGEGGGRETNSYIHSQKKRPETPRGASVRKEKKEEKRQYKSNMRRGYSKQER